MPSFSCSVGQSNRNLAGGVGDLERAQAHADLLRADGHDHALDLSALAHDQVVDGAHGLSVLVGNLSAEQPSFRQVLAGRLALEKRIPGNSDLLGYFRLGLLLFLSQGRDGKRCRGEESESQLVHPRSPLCRSRVRLWHSRPPATRQGQ